MTQLSEHFTLGELTYSSTALRHGIDNTPDETVKAHLKDLCDTILEPMRSLLGVGIHINSGYRCPEVNVIVNGADTSQHMLGGAADTVPRGMDLREAFDKVRKSDIPYDQIIIECGSWIHISLANEGKKPRKHQFIGRRVGGGWKYDPVA